MRRFGFAGLHVARIGEPLRLTAFRRIWISSIFSNLGQQVQAVAAAWTMLQIKQDPGWVASVQTASMLPMMILAIPAGAIADMYDRRKVAMAALAVALGGAAILVSIAAAGMISPIAILICCFVVGCGVALYSPAWQSSAADIVGAESMPAAVALYSLSSNAARSIGPAVGGVIVATFGIVAAFSVNALLYIPLIAALYMWRRRIQPPRLPPERLDRAIVAGLRYVRHAPPLRRVLARTLGTAIGGAAIYAMLPLVARRLLGGGPGTYGLLLGAFGFGAVFAAINIETVRERLSIERTLLLCHTLMTVAMVTAALSTTTALTMFVMALAGAGWLISIAQFNVSVQMFAPRWVAGRSLATFQAACAGGLASGAWVWGRIAQESGVGVALLIAAGWMATAQLLGFFLPLPKFDPFAAAVMAPKDDPVVALRITGRSGPIILQVEYAVAPESAREFYHLMRQSQRSRERDGAFSLTIARDLEQPTNWIERFKYPTWHDYLRSRDRPTETDRKVRDSILALQLERTPPRVRRMLERPFGSVRSRDDARDLGDVPANSTNIIV